MKKRSEFSSWNNRWESLKDVFVKAKRQGKLSSHEEQRPTAVEKNPVAQEIFEQLGLYKFYPKGLHLKDALCIRPETLKLSLNEAQPTDPKQLPYLVLHKLMSYDYLCRSDLLKPQKDDQEGQNGSHSDDSESDDYEDSDDDNGNNTGIHSAGNSNSGIHPVGSLLALILCSDDFLCQDLLSRLAKCQLAVPFILPDPFTKQLSIPLWAMQSIVKEWKCLEQTGTGSKVVQRTHPIVDYGMPIVSFIRFGKPQKRGQSKSKILNEVISESHYDHFFHRDSPGGQYDLLLGDGLVDMCWYLPAGIPADAFPDAVTFLNLHGDARQHLQQSKFLSQISSMCFVLINEENMKYDEQTMDILKKFSAAPGGIVILNDVQQKPKTLKKEIPKAHVVNLTNKNAAEIKESIRNQIKTKLDDVKYFPTINDCCNLKEKIITYNEDHQSYNEGLSLANEIKSIITGHKEKRPSAKEVMLPLQGKSLWQSWAAQDKEQYRQTHRGSKTIIDYTLEVQGKKVAIGEKQLKHVDLLTPVMKSFVASLLKLGGPSNSILRNYFLQCLKLKLDDLSRENISGMQLQYQSTRMELAKLQVKTDPETKSMGEDMIKHLKGKLKDLQEEIISASFGLEHLFREVGQIYEAALQSPVYGEDLTCLPKAIAELLIEGYPLEVMDGDAAHIPRQWVTAVFKEAVKLLKDPRVFVLSVLGLQSTGKSTMLNTAFGLQFNVSAGRCTRGAFIQLLPLDEKLQAQTNCDYVLIVDTEGLRAPELDPTTIQYHDSVLATFVIGLANMTLINIYGEVPGEMDDILQISVHMFLRMNQVQLNPSCQFVHQNAGTNLSSEVGRAKFGQNLNKFAIDAAREENCEGHIAAFNDVIEFNDQKDVHHFPGLWKGDPPMAPVNQGYSHSAQMLKYQFIEILCERARKGALISEFRLSSFFVKVDELWNNLLKENFVFSFKNTLEITAYNSLQRAYSIWDSTFQERMLSWERSAEIAFEKAEIEAVPFLMQQKHHELGVYISKELYGPLKLEMDTFFDGEQSGILVQWKAKFHRKLRNLSRELQEHAEKQCIKLGYSREAISKIETERKEFAKIILEKVEHSILTLQQEEEKLNENLDKGELKTAQLKKLIRRKLFTRDKLTKYKEQNLITKVQEHCISGIIQDCDGQLTESKLKDIMMGAILTKQQAKDIITNSQLSEGELKFEFDTHWSELVSKLTFVKREDIDVEAEVERKLTDFVHAQGYEGVLIWQLQEKNRSLREWGTDLEIVLEEGKHYKCNFLTVGSNHHKEALEITTRVFDEARRYLQEIEENDTDFNAAFAHELLYILSKKISQESAAAKNHLAFTAVYRLDVYLSSCGYAIPRFEKMNDIFKERFDPLFYLEKHVKGPLFVKFKSRYYQTEAEEAIANTLCLYLSGPIKTRVRSALGRKIAMEMKSSEQHFSSKMALTVRVLKDLHDKDDFESYMAYVTDVKTSLEGWIKHYTIEYCDQITSDSGSRLQVSAKEEVSRLVKVVKSQVATCNGNDVGKWFSVLCSDEKIRREVGIAMKPGDLLSGYELLNELNFKKFKLQVSTSLHKLEVELLASFDNIKCEQEMALWKEKPHDFLRKLIGCTEQCPFCGEQCSCQDPDHASKHFTFVHRPTCLKGISNRTTNVMMAGFCPGFVAGREEEKYFVDRRTNQIVCSFKDYRSVFPKWSIPPDVTSQDSLYWKYFVARYKNEIAKRFGAKPPVIPIGWSRVGHNQLMQSLQNQFGF